MAKSWIVVGVVLGSLVWQGQSPKVAAAQPGQTQPAASAYAQPGTQIQVTPDEYRVLVRGEYGTGEIIGGGILGTWFGLGLGHAVQGRWSDKGWIFTFGEIGSVAMLTYGLARCIEEDYYYDDSRHDGCDTGGLYLASGLIGFAVFRIWEIVDVWRGPIVHNQKLRELRWRTGYGAPRWGVFAAPPAKGDGGIAGVTLRF